MFWGKITAGIKGIFVIETDRQTEKFPLEGEKIEFKRCLRQKISHKVYIICGYFCSSLN